MYKSRQYGNKGSSNSFGRKRSFGNKPRSYGGTFGTEKYRKSGRSRSNPYAGHRLNHDLYISKVHETDIALENMYETAIRFEDYNLHPKLLKNIAAKNYLYPTKIQAQVMKPILEKKDVVGLARTGSGKTAAFLIPLINSLLQDRAKKCLIIAPTRELVNQIQTEFKAFALNTGINDVLIVGGASYSTQIRLLRRNPQFVIATPGRLIDIYKQQHINFADFDLIVLDEVDQMLDMGFINDIKLIISKLKPTRQSLFFSATMDNKIRDVAKALLNNPVTVENEQQAAIKNVEQDIVKIGQRNKLETLHELLINTTYQKVLVFSRTKHGANHIAEALRDKGHKVEALHGNKSLGQRTKILSMFKQAQIDILVATDVASRGIDVPDISHVINYDEPATREDYIHRIGRTGRMGKKGWALTFV